MAETGLTKKQYMLVYVVVIGGLLAFALVKWFHLSKLATNLLGFIIFALTVVGLFKVTPNPGSNL